MQGLVRACRCSRLRGIDSVHVRFRNVVHFYVHLGTDEYMYMYMYIYNDLLLYCSNYITIMMVLLCWSYTHDGTIVLVIHS